MITCAAHDGHHGQAALCYARHVAAKQRCGGAGAESDSVEAAESDAVEEQDAAMQEAAAEAVRQAAAEGLTLHRSPGTASGWKCVYSNGERFAVLVYDAEVDAMRHHGNYDTAEEATR